MPTTDTQMPTAAKKEFLTAKTVAARSSKPTGAMGGIVGIVNRKQTPIRQLQLLHFTHVFMADKQERLDLIKNGIEAKLVTKLAKLMRTTQDNVMTTLGLPRTTVMRKISQKQDLSTEQAERVVGLSKLVGQIELMVVQSGNAEGFDAPKWVGEWLERENPALGSRRPAEYMDTVVGQEIVSSLLAQMQSGAYA